MPHLEIPNKIPAGKDRRHGYDGASQSQAPCEIAHKRCNSAEFDELLNGV